MWYDLHVLGFFGVSFALTQCDKVGRIHAAGTDSV